MDASLVSKPIRNVLRWQVIATAVVAAVAAVWAAVGMQVGMEVGSDTDVTGAGMSPPMRAAFSAVLGGLVNMTAVAVYGLVLGISRPVTPAATVVALFRAEASKILVVVLALWLVLTSYKDIVSAAFFGAFVVTVLMFRMAFLERD